MTDDVIKTKNKVINILECTETNVYKMPESKQEKTKK